MLTFTFVKNSNSLSGLAPKHMIGKPFIELAAVNSTNIYAMEQIKANLAAHGTTYFANHQFAGKGQRGKSWAATPGKNLIMSVVVDLQAITWVRPFSLHCMSALACIEMLQSYIPDELSIKWPNDIYWRDRKAGGILIETLFKEGKPAFAVLGIGLNINETDFVGVEKKAVSTLQITGKALNPVGVAKELCQVLNNNYLLLTAHQDDVLHDQYNHYLYKKGELVKLKKENSISTYTIKSVNSLGELVAEAGIEYYFSHGSVEWIMQ